MHTDKAQVRVAHPPLFCCQPSESLSFQPVIEFIDPVIAAGALLSHAEAVAAGTVLTRLLHRRKVSQPIGVRVFEFPKWEHFLQTMVCNWTSARQLTWIASISSTVPIA